MGNKFGRPNCQHYPKLHHLQFWGIRGPIEKDLRTSYGGAWYVNIDMLNFIYSKIVDKFF